MADEENHGRRSAAPNKPSNGSNEKDLLFKALRRQRTNKSFFCISFGIMAVCIAVFLFVVLVVLWVKTPRVRLKTVEVKNLECSSLPPSFNASLSAQMTAKNPNFGFYKFELSMVSFSYGGRGVGASNLGKGEAIVLTTPRLSFDMDVMSNRLREGSNTGLMSDLKSGNLKLSCSGSVSSRVSLWKFINKRKTGNID